MTMVPFYFRHGGLIALLVLPLVACASTQPADSPDSARSLWSRINRNDRAPRTVVTVQNLRTGEVLQRPQARAGDYLEARLEGLSRLCYDVQVRTGSSVISFAATASESAALTGMLTRAGFNQEQVAVITSEGRAVQTAADAADSSRSQVERDRITRLQRTLTTVERAQLTRQAEQLKQALEPIKQTIDALIVLRTQLQGEGQNVKDWNGHQKAVLEALSAFWRAACEGDPVPTPNFSAAETRLQTYNSAVGDLNATRLRIRGQSDEATFLSRMLATLFQRLPADLPVPAEYVRWPEHARQLVSQSGQLLVNLDSLIARDGRLRRAEAEIRPRLSPQPLVQTLIAPNDAAWVEFTTTLTGRRGTPAEGRTLVRTLAVRTRPRPRLFATGGWMVSALPEHQWARENVAYRTDPDPSACQRFSWLPCGRFQGEPLYVAPPDSAGRYFSTFVDRANGKRTVSSPTLLTHVTLTDPARQGWSLQATSGLTYRTVNDRSAPEFLGGLTVGYGSRIYLSGVLHLGRVERMLLSPQARSRPVPTSITRSSAVGEQWKIAPALTLSLGL
jgi:hypothetical protein